MKPEKSAFFRAGKAVSFLLALFLFLFIFLNLIFNAAFLHANLLLVAELFVVVAFVNLILPRALHAAGEKKFSAGINAGARLFAEKFSAVIVGIGLLLTYVIAVGIVFIISKIAGKKFLQLQKTKKRSYWIVKKPVADSAYFKKQY